MIVERIKKLDINNRPIFTGLYGHCYGDEYFVEDNLCKYSFWQELYRYLRSEGYTTVFYNAEFNFFSYEESQLETFFFKKPEDIANETAEVQRSSRRFIAPIASPNGHNRRRGIRLSQGVSNVSTPDPNADVRITSLPQDSSGDQLMSHRPNAILVKKIAGDQFFQLKRNEGVLSALFDFIDKNPQHKIALIFTKPSGLSFHPHEGAWLTRLQSDYSRQRVAGLNYRLIVLYDVKDVVALYHSLERKEGGFFFDGWFRDQMFPNYNEARPDLQKPSHTLFYVEGWGKDEVGNVLKRRRITEGLQHTLSPIPFNDLCMRIWRKFQTKDSKSQENRNIDTVKDFMELPKAIIESQIQEMTMEKQKKEEDVLVELNQLIGLRMVKDTIEGIIADVKAQHMRAKVGQVEESKIGLNFVFKGNPGTGKTTVARLLGNILASYGLIDDPEVVTYTKGKLIDGYVGGGSRNVEKMFEDAVGKVLFIDEAYQLANPDSKDALDALTNMLTDKRFEDKLAIVLAGYPGEMAELIGSNPGLKSRFTQDVFFENYTNDELTEIFRRKLIADHFIIGDEALAHARAYFTSLRRNKDFGNARETKKLREKVRTKQGRRLTKTANPSTEDVFTFLPQDFPNYGKIKVEDFLRPQQEQSVSPMDQLNQLVGIDVIRKTFEEYVAMAHFCQENPQSKMASIFRPHMAFLGNPGTGKTTVARLFGEILRQEGLLTNTNFVEVGSTDLIEGYLGQSGPKARKQFERARGGILFIDEAYQLCRKDQVHGGDQYGKEVITELMTFMENDRDTIVILAGYTDEIRYLIQHGNPGLPSRVTNEFIFEDYEPDVLYKILLKKLGEYELSNAFKTNMRQIIDYEYKHRKQKEWGNAREIEKYAAEIFKTYLTKHKGKGVVDIDCIPERLLKDLVQNQPQQVTKVTRESTNTPVMNQSSLSIDLTSNPLERRVTDPNMLKERATGLLKSAAGEGTGFIISITDRYILTCSHVVEGAGDELSFFMNCNKEFETAAHVLWTNYEQDMALLQIDELPEDACYVQLDNNINQDPQGLTELVLCGYPDGSAFASTPSLISGAINNYEKGHVWNDRCFDTIYANVSATHGCSGGPVVRKSDMMLVGILQGGKEGGEIQFITDIHQLYRNINIKS